MSEEIKQAIEDVLCNCVLWTVNKEENLHFDLDDYERKQDLIYGYIQKLEQENQQLKEKIRILTEHPFLSKFTTPIKINKVKE